MPCMACHAGWLLGLAILWPAENAKIPDPLALFSKAGNSWPARPCRMFAGVSPAKSDGKFIFTPSDSDLVVWNDVSCSSGAATAELRVTRTFQEAVDAIAFLPPKTIVIASKRSWHGMNYATLRFYNAGDLGHSTAPMFTRRFDGHITSLMVLGNDLLFAATFTKEGEHFIHCLSNVLTERKKSSQTLKTQYPVQKILAFQNFVVGASWWQLMIWRRETMFGHNSLPIQWEVPSRSNTTRSMSIEDICLLQPHYLAVAANPVNGFGGGAVLYVFDLRKAEADGFNGAELVAQRQETVLKSLAGISDLGLAVGLVNRSVNLYRISDLLSTQQPYKRLTVVKSFPTKLGFVHGAYLAVGTAENQVETFGLKRLLRSKSRGQASMIIPIESRVVDFLELPGQGLAVAGLQHVHFFSASATQLTSSRHTSFASLSFCMESAGVRGRILGFQPLSQQRVMVALPDCLVLCKLELPNANVYRYAGNFLLPDSSHTNFMALSFASLEIPQANLLAVGGCGQNLVLHNLSDATTVRETNYTTHLRTTLMVQALASHGTTLMAGTQNHVYVWTTEDFRQWTRVDRILHHGNCWDLAYLGNDLWAAASEMEVVTLYHFDGALKALKTLGVKGPAYALSPLSGSLLVVTDFYLHLFQAEALDPALPLNFSAAELPVNGVNSPPPANSISIVGNAILVGLELYRPRNPDAECAQGTYSPPGAFECRLCPDGWTSFGAAGSCSYPNGDTLLFMIKLLFLALLVFVWMVPQLLRRLMKMSNVSVFAEAPDGVHTPTEKVASQAKQLLKAAAPYALVLAFPVYAGLSPGRLLALAPLGSALLAAWPAKPSTARAGLICLAASSFVCSVSLAVFLCQVCGVLRFANLAISGCNAYFTLQIRRWLNNSFVDTQDGIRANTAGVRVIIMLSAVLYFSSGCLVVLNLSQHHGHEVWTPLGVAEPSDTFLPTYLLAVSTALSRVALGFAANACLEAEELHQPSLWARDEKVPPAKLPRRCRVPWLLRLSSWCKSWRFRHFLFLASALYDSYTFYRGLQTSKKALSSQMYDFAAILFFALFTASINAMALLLDQFRMRLPELGDRNFRLSSLCKCILLFLKLRVLKVPLVVFAHMDSTWLTEYSGYIREKDERIPIWMCSDTLSCPFRCRDDLAGNCTYTSQPVYLGCFCQYSTAGIPVVSDRFVVFGNCLISACIIALLTNSRMRTRGLFRFPDLSLFALGCVTFLPTAFIAINTVYLSVPQLARMHLDSWSDFLVLTVPALIFVVMANEMARRIETAWKFRFLGHEERVKLRSSEGQWQVVDGAPHLLGARVEALDGEGRSLLRTGSAVTVQGPAVLFFKNPHRYGSLWVSSGFRALTPLAHLSTLLAIYQVWQRLFQGVIFVDVLILLVLSGASGVLNFTLMDEEVVSLSIRRPSRTRSSLTTQILFDDAKDDSRTGSGRSVELQPA